MGMDRSAADHSAFDLFDLDRNSMCRFRATIESYMGTWVLCFLCLTGSSLAAGAETPSPALLVLNKADKQLAIVDPASGKVIARVGVGEGPHEVAVSADGKFAFVGNYGERAPGTTISVIDLPVQEELHRVDLGPLRRPHGMFFVDGKLLFTAEQNRLVARYDPVMNDVDWLFGTGQATTHMVIANADASLIFTANIGSNSVSAIERTATPAGWGETVIAVGKGPEGIDWSPDGKEVWTATGGDGGVSIINVASKKVTETLNVGTKRTNRLKFTPDGKWVLLSDRDGDELVILDRATHKERARLKMGKYPEGILITPDSSRAYVAQEGANDIAVIDLNTLAVAGHISPGNGPDGMAWAVRK
jgi:YVTN family beta-propeller protein